MVTVVVRRGSREEPPTVTVRLPVPASQRPAIDDHDDACWRPTCSDTGVERPGASVTRSKPTSFRTACWIDAGRSADGPRYTCGTSEPAREPVLRTVNDTSKPPSGERDARRPE